VPLSILDLAPVPDGGNVGDALRATIDLAQHAEGLGFRRFWVAEHHNMPGIASSAPPVLIGHIAGVPAVRYRGQVENRERHGLGAEGQGGAGVHVVHA
jgi:hypothetical protein